MFFNSLDFALFLPVVFFLYWFIARNNLKIQNILLLVASYFFYACWDWRFLFLLIFSTLLDYATGLSIAGAKKELTRKTWFYLTISVNLGFLAIFKYYNFFAESLVTSLAHVNLHLNLWTLNIILPVGISFYTFHGLSYVIDIYQKRIAPEKNFIDYSVFVSFFPLLVAGPIERATHLLPQIKVKKEFQYAKVVDGLKQILWGLAKKIIIADHLAIYANMIFEDPSQYASSAIILGAICFAFQIYCDFSGYSDIALGTARLFGIELLKNFEYPYFSRDIAEFWRRWHISLSTWFRDYLYIPLGGSKGGTWMKIRNTFIIFIVSGFWHGANWTFIAWGALNALFFLPLMLTNKNRTNIEIAAKGRILPSIKEFASIVFTFCLTTFAWIFFRSDSISSALDLISHLFSISIFSVPALWPIKLILAFIVIEWLGREQPYAIAKFGLKWPKTLRWAFYYLLIGAILYTTGSEQQFIYFQF